jgi:hypothetical protein
MNDNSIRLYTYEDAIEMYKQHKEQQKRNTLTGIYNYFINKYITQKIIGLTVFILTVFISIIIQDPTALIFMFPICLGLMLLNQKIL